MRFMDLARLAEWAERVRVRARERDERRGYSVEKKRIFIAYFAETVIVAASLWGAWLFAQMYGHDDWRQIQMMLLAPIGYAVIEYCRVPLALSVRTHQSKFIKLLAVLGVLCAAGVTVKSMSQLGEIMFRPRLFDVVHAAENLQHAQATLATVGQQVAVAESVVVSRRTEFERAEERAKSDAIQLANLPKEQCNATSGVTRDGRPYKGQTCRTDPRVGPLRDNLKLTVTARDEARSKLEQAVAARSRLDVTEADKAVADARDQHREAVLHSQLHSFTAMVFGVAPSDVTDEQIARFLRIFVFVPAIFVSFASTLLAFTAVHRLKQKIDLDPASIDYMLNYERIVKDAVRATVHEPAMAGDN